MSREKMYYLRVLITTVLLTSCFQLSCACPREIDDSTKEVLEQASNGWKVYEEKYNAAQGKLRVIVDVDTDGKLLHQDDTIELKSNGNLLLAESIERADSSVQSPQLMVFGLNDVYEFQLTRNTREDPWWASRINSHEYAHFGTMSRQVFKNLRTICPIAIGGTLLRDLVGSDAFTLERCSRLDGGSVEIEFTMNYADILTVEDTRQRVQWAKCVLDPNLLWCVRRAEVRKASASVTSNSVCTFEYGSSESAGFVLPKTISIESTTQAESGPVVHGMLRYNSELIIPDRLPRPDEFTLTAYGLPEPEWAERRMPTWIWCGLVAAVLIAGGVLGFFVTKHRAS